ncbi:hypothetical protein IWQ61_002383 [Dispira simplex]|nr:hypothetical protein IWQ61_002383 [Dispira simplex]
MALTVQAIPRPEGQSDAEAALGSASEPWYANYFSECVDGTMRCDRTNRTNFYVCDHNNPVKFQCGPGTVCYTNGDYIICDYP